MRNFKMDILARLFGVIAAILTGIVIGSIFTIMSINVIFGTNISVSIETVSAIIWLTVVISGLVKGSKQ